MSDKDDPAPADGPAAVTPASVAPADVARIWAVMSHEIRTPLMGVVGMLDVLNRTSLTDEQRRIIGTAEDSSGTLMRIIDDVLDFAKLESAQVNLDVAPADPVAIVESAAELLANIAGSKRIAITCEALDNPPFVLCDEIRIRQILLNIGTNAVKHTENGSVDLKVAVTGADADTVALRFSVIDTGQGIPLEMQGFLFEPFWQLAGREASIGGMGGVGLGLAICRSLVDAMGGHISVESTPGLGTRFDVDVTFTRAPVAAAPPPRLEDMEIISLEADDATLAIALRYLGAAGASIVRVDNLGALGRYVLAPQKKAVILLGSETEVEDVEAMAAGLQRMGSERLSSVVWLHHGAAGSLPANSGVWPVRTNPLHRADLFAAVTRTRGSREGDGFAVVARHQAQFVDPIDAAHAARADGLVILVAEDNKVNQEVLRQQLAILGYDCDIASTGHAALKALAERSYPLLLCDCHMPGMDGFELTRLIRGREAAGAPHMPIVAVTANAVPGEANRCRAAGMDDYLAKPIEIGALRAKLNRWIGPPKTQAVWAPTLPPMHGHDRVLDLRNLSLIYGEDPKRLAPMIEQWSSSMKEVLGDLEECVRSGAWEAALAATHRIKGSAGVAGAARLSAAAAALEVALQNGDVRAIAREGEQVRTLTLAGVNEAAEWRRAASSQAVVSAKAAS